MAAQRGFCCEGKKLNQEKKMGTKLRVSHNIRAIAEAEGTCVFAPQPQSAITKKVFVAKSGSVVGRSVGRGDEWKFNVVSTRDDKRQEKESTMRPAGTTRSIFPLLINIHRFQRFRARRRGGWEKMSVPQPPWAAWTHFHVTAFRNLGAVGDTKGRRF
jgi:hypothetical protein